LRRFAALQAALAASLAAEPAALSAALPAPTGPEIEPQRAPSSTIDVASSSVAFALVAAAARLISDETRVRRPMRSAPALRRDPREAELRLADCAHPGTCAFEQRDLRPQCTGLLALAGELALELVHARPKRRVHAGLTGASPQQSSAGTAASCGAGPPS
jgi:hypothetical protein